MARSLYLVNPKGESPSYFGAEVYELWGFEPTQGIADLALPTVAAMAPPELEIELCDEYVQPVDFDTEADVVGLTGKITQASRMLALADEFRRRGKTVMIGGPYASLSPEAVRGACDVLVRGPLEAYGTEARRDRRPVGRDGFNLIRRLIRLGPEERKMWTRIEQALAHRPETSLWVMDSLARYAQVRAMYEEGSFWEPELTERPLGVPTPDGGTAENLVSLGG